MENLLSIQPILELAMSSMDIVVSGTEEVVMMVEASGKEIPEEQMVNAIMFGHTFIRVIVQTPEGTVGQVRKRKTTYSTIKN